VEDEPSLRKLTHRTLKDMGYTVLEATDAAQAIDVARNTDAPIDLLLTDVIMPGMSGGDLAKKLSPENPHMRVLFMSGYTDGAIEIRGSLPPGMTVLRKPFTRDVLLRTVEGALAHPPRESQIEDGAVHAGKETGR
jgi:two-component system cell cycle sensor histidine kinase/response regulator CckA